MGQQQLLLIVLGLLIIGLAIVAGVNIFHANAIEAKRNNVTNDLLHLASEAQKYYKTPKLMGGGSRSFIGWEIPKRLRTNADGDFFSATISKDNVVLIGTGNEVVQGNDSVKVKMTVTADDYEAEIIN